MSVKLSMQMINTHFYYMTCFILIKNFHLFMNRNDTMVPSYLASQPWHCRHSHNCYFGSMRIETEHQGIIELHVPVCQGGFTDKSKDIPHARMCVYLHSHVSQMCFQWECSALLGGATVFTPDL